MRVLAVLKCGESLSLWGVVWAQHGRVHTMASMRVSEGRNCNYQTTVFTAISLAFLW